MDASAKTYTKEDMQAHWYRSPAYTAEMWNKAFAIPPGGVLYGSWNDMYQEPPHNHVIFHDASLEDDFITSLAYKGCAELAVKVSSEGGAFSLLTSTPVDIRLLGVSSGL